MIVTISPSLLTGSITAPASKSAMQRACALALLNNGETILQNPGNSNDDLAAMDIISRSGASITINNDESVSINSKGIINVEGQIHCGESGLSLRMFTPVLALSKKEIMIGGEGSLLKRPVHFFDTVLPLLDVRVKSNKGFLPITVTGPLNARDICIDGSMSSQYLTGLLFAFAKAAKNTITISVRDLKSKPYVDLSLQMLQHFGYDVTNDSYTAFRIVPVENKNRKIQYTTEGDWSGGSFLLVAGAIASSGITIRGLSVNSLQADKAILQVLKICGVKFSLNENEIMISPADTLKPFTFDATDCPDLFPPLVALAAYCNGTSVIKGTSRLLTKESNRLESLKDVFTKMGIEIITEEDSMKIIGGSIIHGAEVDAHHDHRIVMACTVAALGGKGKVVISGAEAVSKSYPDFFEHIKKMGAIVILSS